MNEMDDRADEASHVYAGWADDEGMVVGNRKGLVQLRGAIDEALTTGESEQACGEFVGVRCMATQAFEDEESDDPLLYTVFAWLLVGLVSAVFAVGLNTILAWLVEGIDTIFLDAWISGHCP
jgi:hypothetical protein